MAENFLISIKTTTLTDGERDQYTFSTVGDFEVTENGHRFSYKDSEATGFEGCMTTLDAVPGCVTLVRSGKLDSTLILEEGKKHMCHYATPYGVIQLGVSTLFIRNGLTGNGGTLDFGYSLDFNSSTVTKNLLRITIREKKNKNA